MKYPRVSELPHVPLTERWRVDKQYLIIMEVNAMIKHLDSIEFQEKLKIQFLPPRSDAQDK